MQEKGIDYFENRQQATLIHREDALRNGAFAGGWLSAWE